MPEVISDTSPVQYLYQTNLLDLLPALYQRIFIPQAVFDELKVGRAHNINLPDISTLSWTEVRQVTISSQLVFASIAVCKWMEGVNRKDAKTAKRHQSLFSIN